MGGKIRTTCTSRRNLGMSGAGAQDKTPVIGVRERATGKVKAKVANTVSSITLQNMIQESADGRFYDLYGSEQGI